MNSKLTTLYKHYEEIMQELSTDVVAKDIDRYTKLMKEQNDLEPIIKAYKAYLDAEKMEQDSLNIIDTESDEDMLAMAREDLANAKKEKERLDEEIKILLIPKDPMDDKNIIIEIRQGA
ncbi:MAG: PCRF domain-containing protein, partial [Lachnospiraceae bacterium]|nr:PCRF domain-containing protein [Lachnospiraceae bacterium]